MGICCTGVYTFCSSTRETSPRQVLEKSTRETLSWADSDHIRDWNLLHGSVHSNCPYLTFGFYWKQNICLTKCGKVRKKMHIFRTGELHLLFERKGRPLQNGKQMETGLPWKDKMGVFQIAKFICQNFTFSCQAECTFQIEWGGMMSHTQLDC